MSRWLGSDGEWPVTMTVACSLSQLGVCTHLVRLEAVVMVRTRLGVSYPYILHTHHPCSVQAAAHSTRQRRSPKPKRPIMGRRKYTCSAKRHASVALPV
ncbi:hypothetical protein GY45DRAFT_545612 [Cubamyces sp. BRFM 1775]|nr:hypothetical protein GY45DRAFT_545612 [Cubamyces sp. BRFM 1775]